MYPENPKENGQDCRDIAAFPGFGSKIGRITRCRGGAYRVCVCVCVAALCSRFARRVINAVSLLSSRKTSPTVASHTITARIQTGNEPTGGRLALSRRRYVGISPQVTRDHAPANGGIRAAVGKIRIFRWIVGMVSVGRLPLPCSRSVRYATADLQLHAASSCRRQRPKDSLDKRQVACLPRITFVYNTSSSKGNHSAAARYSPTCLQARVARRRDRARLGQRVRVAGPLPRRWERRLCAHRP